MKNRDKIISRINAGVSKDLQGELDFHLTGIDREEPEAGERPFDMSNAFDEVQDFADSVLGYSLLQRECRQILIDLGYYRVMSQKEIDSIMVTRGTKWDFKMGGLPYTCRDNRGFAEWLEQ